MATRNTACTKNKSLPLAHSLVSETLFFLQLWQYFVNGIQRFVMKIADVLLCGNSQRSETQLLFKAAFCAWWSQSGAIATEHRTVFFGSLSWSLLNVTSQACGQINKRNLMTAWELQMYKVSSYLELAWTTKPIEKFSIFQARCYHDCW